MGWKCPNCRHHVYGNINGCPYCSADLCEYCGYSTTENHHISYDPEIVIQLCRECHNKVHYPDHRDPDDDHDLLDRLDPDTGRKQAQPIEAV